MAKCELERIKEMKKFLECTEENLLKKRMDKIQSICRDEEKVKEELFEIIEELTEGKEAGSIVMSFLRSSYITGSHEFYIAYYFDEPFVEEEPDSRYYSLDLFFEGIDSDLDCINKELGKNYIRILSSEKEEIRRWFVNNIYIGLGKIFKLLFEDMQPQRNLEVFYGSYMGELELIGKV